MDLKQYCINGNVSVREAIKVIDANGKKTVFIVDERNKLEGIFTDGDIRRYILRNGDLAAPIRDVMNKNPTVFRESDGDAAIEEFKKTNMLVCPIVDDLGCITRVLFWDEKDQITADDAIPDGVPLVIQAGGKGTRLYPYTKILPKPLIPIGDIPISEHIINNFYSYNCRDFFMILNHGKNMIKAYFSEIEKSYRLCFLDENEFLGTGGGLRLLMGHVTSTFFVSNCDILIDANYGKIYRYHKEHGNKITMVCAMKNFAIPYGVIELDEKGDIAKMREKPEFSFLTNTGLYVIEPEVIDAISPNTFIHLPEIVQMYRKKKDKVGVYPILEKQWLDMGQFAEMENMIKVLEERKHPPVSR